MGQKIIIHHFLVLLSERSERKGHRPPETGLGRDGTRGTKLG